MHNLITDIGIAVIIATIAGFIAYRLGQPIILAYFIAGVIVGPEIGPQLITDSESIEVISELGLILLLFIIGLEMNPEKIISMVKRLIIPGIGQFVLSALLSLGIFYLLSSILPFHKLELLYLSIGVSLSSTAIVIKMLHDKYELDSVAGRISLGILIFQDIWAIFVIVLQPRFDNPSIIPVLTSLLKGAALVTGGILFSKYILRRVFESIVRSPEMVVAVSLGWASLSAGTAYMIGLSMEMGALIAGISIASFPYSMHVTLKIQPLRDFFLTLFFISLGMKITMPKVEFLYLVPIVILVTFATRYLTLYPLLRFSGTGSRNAFVASLNLSQISEFSLVIAAIGISLGHISKELVSVLIYAMAISAIMSSYLIRYNGQIYHFFSGRKATHNITKEDDVSEDIPSGRDIFILGFHRGARALIEHLRKHKPTLLDRIVVIDYNQEVIRELKQQKIFCIYGDISHEDTLEHVHIANAKFIISTIPDLLLRGTDNIHLVKMCRRLNPEAYIIATAELKNMIHPMKVAGANYVVLPYSLLAGDITRMLETSSSSMIPSGL